MGQQQLLLIVLSIILVAVAIIIGLDRFDAQAESSNRDAVIIDLNRISGFAIQYFRKPILQMGGDKSFIGFGIPPAMDTTVNGVYTIVSVEESTLLLQGVGIKEVGDEYVTYQLLVELNSVTVNKIF